MSNIELFLDRHRISWEHNIDRQLNPPRKFEGNPILEGEHPWEASFVAVYGNVLPREGGAGFESGITLAPRGTNLTKCCAMQRVMMALTGRE
ncbi:MAG: hypothetical protein CMJ20_03080 [Phycisphaeraceae bacterium]|nr:hypothetical protein [Phycisphaeraceae bacterium]|tara:strand:+ start:1935 stop:2210 length:276 start_codon:yes stop_codon:yes gene_type:complete